MTLALSFRSTRSLRRGALAVALAAVVGTIAAQPGASHGKRTTAASVETVLFDFESGGLAGWQRKGTAFVRQPTYGENVRSERVFELSPHSLGGSYSRNVPYRIGLSGSYWIGTADLRPTPHHPWGRMRGDGAKGILTSPAFRLTKRYLTFRMGGRPLDSASS